MPTRNITRMLFALALSVTIGLPAFAQEATVYRALTAAQLENALQKSKLEFTKLADPKASGSLYDFKIRDFNLRLTYTAGDRLLLDTLFPALPLDKANQWNLAGKFTRAAVGEDNKGASYAVLESQLNIKGAVTGGAIHEFLGAYVKELAEFESFVQAALPRKDIAKEEDGFKELLPARLDNVLADMKIQFTKVPLKGGHFAYRYQAKDTPIVLTNWGKDMMLEAKFPKLPLDKINQYNLERKFIRAVGYKNKIGEYSGLEANMSFQGGATDSILRNFIAVFEEDVREFGAYANKANQ